jgi:hypothetical protein
MAFSLEDLQKLRAQLEALNDHLATKPRTDGEGAIAEELDRIQQSIDHTRILLILQPGYVPPPRPVFPPPQPGRVWR